MSNESTGENLNTDQLDVMIQAIYGYSDGELEAIHSTYKYGECVERAKAEYSAQKEEWDKYLKSKLGSSSKYQLIRQLSLELIKEELVNQTRVNQSFLI